MGIVALRVLEGGALATGLDRHPFAGAASSAENPVYTQQAQTLRFLAQDGETTLVSAAIRFALANAALSTVLVGISDVIHVDEAADAEARGPLDAEQLARIGALHDAGFPAAANLS
jgi:aryl-alcohol dehydrogenase-like predicted oxidoreductase